MKQSDFIRLKKIAEADLKIDENNVLNKSLNVPILYHKYLDIFIKEISLYKKMRRDKAKIYKELYTKYKFEGNYQLDSKGEVDSFVHGDDIYYNIAHACDEQEKVVKYLEEVMSTINKMTFTIKNFIQYTEFLAGK